MASDMRIDPQRTKQLAENFANVVQRIQAVNKSNRPVRLILVSKLKPASDILAVHTSPPPSLSSWSTHFGENYYQELLEKSAVLPRSIKWHFIGGLQSNKCKPLAEQIPNLWCVSSVDSAKKADQLEKGRAALVVRVEEEGGGGFGEGGEFESRLRVMVQVNTSGEEAKSGVEPGEALELCKYIGERCPHLRLSGLMTIGAIARSKATTPGNENEDFVCLRETRDKVAEALGIANEELELSMGMSSDFEGAIALGSNEVRIGSTIFGERPPKKDAKVKDHTEGRQG